MIANEPDADSNAFLYELLSLPCENEVVEFKEAKSTFDKEKLCQYFSALANEANLKTQEVAWLVFGVADNRRIVGTAFKNSNWELEKLKREIAQNMTGNIGFRAIHEIVRPEGRVLIFEIPAAPKGIPIAYNGHYYGRLGESLVALDIDKIERIRNQDTSNDWSAGLLPEADINDLDPTALVLGRKNFAIKNPRLAAEINAWDNMDFLRKAKLAVKDSLTRAAIVLLGKRESDYYLKPAVAGIRWILENRAGEKIDYAHFDLPFILAIDDVLAKIRILRYRYVPKGTLFPEEVDTYDTYLIREALNNCIAHQDYRKAGVINVVEKSESLIFTNLGNFLPGEVERVVIDDAPTEVYRNALLANAMHDFNMVDKIGHGIRKMFEVQKNKFFPLPDYDMRDERVKLTIVGKVIDPEFASLLARNSNLTLKEIIALDKVQKRIKISDDDFNRLKKAGLIEGTKRRPFIAKEIAQRIGEKAEYSKNKGLDEKYYIKLIVESLKDHGCITRDDIDKLLLKKLPDSLDSSQRIHKVSNILQKMRRKNLITNKGTRAKPQWMLFQSEEDDNDK